MKKRSHFASFISHICPVRQGVSKDFLKKLSEPFDKLRAGTGFYKIFQIYSMFFFPSYESP